MRLAQEMRKRGHRVTVFSDNRGGRSPVYPLEDGVTVRRVSHSGKHAEIQRLRSELRSADFDACVVLGAHLFWVVALLGTGVPCVYSERGAPEHIEEGWSRAGRLAAMSGADAIHLFFPDYLNSLPEFLHERVTFIANPAPDPVAEDKAKDAGVPPYRISSVSRIVPVKQIPLLIEAFGLIYERFPDWRLDIWGEECDGEWHTAATIAAGPARSRTTWRGVAKNARKVLRESDIFCIPSKREGASMTVLEAIACGTPVVGFADCPGVSPVVQDGISGLLAPEMTAESLAATLAGLMADKELRVRLGRGALRRATDYAAENIFDQWEALCIQAAASKGRTRMDAFSEEPFASMARLSAAARREYLSRNFGDPWPGTLRWHGARIWKKLRSGLARGKA